mmetsp:Transcript_8803/g.16650  ORF Transcript_8803/g.16650 Transcript_8803/m.16650 type:complete len:512 (+) Transcript_8803:74-1609(+)
MKKQHATTVDNVMKQAKADLLPERTEREEAERAAAMKKFTEKLEALQAEKELLAEDREREKIEYKLHISKMAEEHAKAMQAQRKELQQKAKEKGDDDRDSLANLSIGSASISTPQSSTTGSPRRQASPTNKTEKLMRAVKLLKHHVLKQKKAAQAAEKQYKLKEQIWQEKLVQLKEKVSPEGDRGVMEEKLAKMQRKVVELVQERAEMEEQLEEAKYDGLKARKAKLVKAVQEKEEENQRLKKQVDEEKSRYSKFETDFAQMRFKLAESQSEKEELQEQLDGYADIEDTMKAQLTDMKRQMEQKDGHLGRQKSEVLKLKVSLKKLMKRYAELEKQLHAANKKVAAAEAAEDDDESAAADAAKTGAAGDKDDDLRARYAALEEKTKEYKDALTNKDQEIQTLRAAADPSAATTLEKYKRAVQMLKLNGLKQQREFKKRENDFKKRENELNEKLIDLEGLVKHKLALESELADDRGKLQIARAEIDDLTNEKEDLLDEIAELKERLATYEEEA